MEEFLKQLSEIDSSLDTLLANDELTPEQKTEHDGLVARRASTLKKIDAEKAKRERAEQRDTLESQEREAAAKAAAKAASTQVAIETGRRTNAATIEAKNVNVIKHRNYTPKNFATGTLSERQERAYRFGMFGMAVLSQDLGKGYRNRTAEDWLEKNMAVHQSNNNTGSHILIPDEFSQDMIVLRERYGVARRVLRVEPMASDTKIVPRRASGLTAYGVAEGSAGTESNKTWNDVRLVAKDWMVISRWSAQVDADAVINFGDDLAGEASYAFSLKEDQCAFTGDGTSTYQGIMGVQTRMGNFDNLGTASYGIYTQATSNTWSAIVLADFNNTVALLPQYADTPNAVWVCSRTFYYGVMQKVELAAGGVTLQEVSQGDRRPRPLFLGYPVEFTQVMPTATATATIPCLLGDFGRAAMFGDRQQDGLAFSDSAVINGESTFERNQIAIRVTERFDINVHDVGNASVAGPIVALKTGS